MAEANGKRLTVGVYRLCYQAREHPEVGGWFARSVHALVSAGMNVRTAWIDRAPVYAARNAVVELGRQNDADYIVMVDHDIHPDVVPEAPAFLDAALAFAHAHDGPCVIAAPACLADGSVNVRQEVSRNGQQHLVAIDPQDAAERTGMEAVPAIGCGLILFDMRAFDRLPKPYFGFGYTDESFTTVANGEDVGLTARLTEAGVPIYCAWDSWAGHWKEVLFGKPQPTIQRRRLLIPGEGRL